MVDKYKIKKAQTVQKNTDKFVISYLNTPRVTPIDMRKIKNENEILVIIPGIINWKPLPDKQVCEIG